MINVLWLITWKKSTVRSQPGFLRSTKQARHIREKMTVFYLMDESRARGNKNPIKPLPYANWSFSPEAAGREASMATWLKSHHIFDHTCNCIPNEQLAPGVTSGSLPKVHILAAARRPHAFRRLWWMNASIDGAHQSQTCLISWLTTRLSSEPSSLENPQNSVYNDCNVKSENVPRTSEQLEPRGNLVPLISKIVYII